MQKRKEELPMWERSEYTWWILLLNFRFRAKRAFFKKKNKNHFLLWTAVLVICSESRKDALKIYIYIGHIYTFLCVKWIIYINIFRCYKTRKPLTLSNSKASNPRKRKRKKKHPTGWFSVWQVLWCYVSCGKMGRAHICLWNRNGHFLKDGSNSPLVTTVLPYCEHQDTMALLQKY